MNFLKKIQSLPESTRKIILWSVIIIIGLSLAAWWTKNFQERLKQFKESEFRKEFQLPSLKKELEGLPKVEIPEIKIEDLEKMIKEVEK